MLRVMFCLFVVCALCNTAEAKYTDEVVKVTRVIDGDTIEVIYQDEIEVVRLYGIDCPEKSEEGFEKAKKYTESEIASSTGRVELSFPKDLKKKRDHFGRLLAVITLEHKYVDKQDNSKVQYFKYPLNVSLVDTKNAIQLSNTTLSQLSNNQLLSIDELLAKNNNDIEPKLKTKELLLRYSAEQYMQKKGYVKIKANYIALPVSPELITNQILDINSSLYDDEIMNSNGEYDSFLIDALVFEHGVGVNGANIFIVVPQKKCYPEGLAYAKFNYSGNIQSIVSGNGDEIDLAYCNVCTLNEYISSFPRYVYDYKKMVTDSIIRTLNL